MIYNGHFYLGDNTSVFQAELKAIQKSAEMLHSKGWINKNITIFSDSQASLAALSKLTITSDTVNKCNKALNILGENNKVHLRWVKAHVGIPGNEVADALAKCGTALGEGPSNEILPSYTKQKQLIYDYFKDKWSKAWILYPEARQTKIWFPIPNAKKSHQLLQMNRVNLSKFVQFITGHNKLERHRNLQKGISDPESCRLCMEDEETSWHIIADCPALLRTRQKIFHKNLLQEPIRWKVHQINNFIGNTIIGDMLEGKDLENQM